MNEIRKEKLRIVNLFDEINERGIASLTLEMGRPGSVPLSVTHWSANNDVLCTKHAFGSSLLVGLKNVRQYLEQILKTGQLPVMDVEETA